MHVADGFRRVRQSLLVDRHLHHLLREVADPDVHEILQVVFADGGVGQVRGRAPDLGLGGDHAIHGLADGQKIGGGGLLFIFCHVGLELGGGQQNLIGIGSGDGFIAFLSVLVLVVDAGIPVAAGKLAQGG